MASGSPSPAPDGPGSPFSGSRWNDSLLSTREASPSRKQMYRRTSKQGSISSIGGILDVAGAEQSLRRGNVMEFGQNGDLRLSKCF
jgi:hypothetical protein